MFQYLGPGTQGINAVLRYDVGVRFPRVLAILAILAGVAPVRAAQVRVPLPNTGGMVRSVTAPTVLPRWAPSLRPMGVSLPVLSLPSVLPDVFAPVAVPAVVSHGRAVPAADIPDAVAARGEELFDAVRKLAERGFQPKDYDASRRWMFGTSDNIEVDGVRGIMDSYSQIFVPGRSDDGNNYPERGDLNQDGFIDREGMNAEHLWPQSFFTQREPMRSDLHHLMPTFIHINEVRGHLPFGEVTGQAEYSNSAGAKMGQGVFEPPDAVKGRVARAMFYFFLRYHDNRIRGKGYGKNFWNGKIEMLMRWSRDFPPDEQERRRNDLVEKFQGNRNPFIDDPALIERIGMESFQTKSREQLARVLRAKNRKP